MMLQKVFDIFIWNYGTLTAGCLFVMCFTPC